MNDTARLRVEMALLRSRVDTLQNDLLDLVAVHSQTLAAVAHLAGMAPDALRPQETGSAD